MYGLWMDGHRTINSDEPLDFYLGDSYVAQTLSSKE